MQAELDWKGRRRQIVLLCGPRRSVAGEPMVAQELAGLARQDRHRWKAVKKREWV